ncbi:leucine-rich repeat domain-containing protein [Brachyspira pilosicoli]|uniref:leucine-rich repeat domain-containing protein n=1 Tax=Brachyspira pilosicoli TaxID=52584 RepID=UPI003004A006
MYKKFIFDKIILILGLLFIFSCSNPNNPNNDNNGDGGFTGPTEEELIKKYGIDIGQDDATISQQIEANLKAYHDEMGSYRVILTGTPKDYSTYESLYTLTLKAALKVSSSMNIELDIKNIDFQDNTIKTGMFKGYSVDGTENIVISFIFPENKITTIGVRAFDSLYNTKEITIPDSVTTIESEAFYSSISIEKLTLGKNLKTIGDQAFVYANGLKEVIIPDSVKTIGIGAFSGPKIETLKLSSSLESIGDYAFDSTSITELTIPASVKSIGMQAFAFSQQLTTVTYLGTTPNDITSAGMAIFYKCDMLRTLIVPNAPETTTEALKSKWQNFLGGNFTDVRKE